MKFVLLFWAVSCILVKSEDCDGKDEDGTCLKKDVEESEHIIPMPCVVDERPRLYRWDPVKVGHKRKIQIRPGHEVEMITRALKPLMFEIPKFLSDEECDAVIELGKNKMISSKLHDVDNRIGKIVTNYEDYIENIYAWDRDNDQKITINEVIQFAKRYKYLYITADDVHDMFTKHNIKPENKDYLTDEEFMDLPFKELHLFFANLKTESPLHRDRYSYQAWIQHNKKAPEIVKTIQKRVEKITKLTREQVRAGEPLQIVKYTKHGHFNTHHDGQDKEQHPDLKCCHLDVKAAPKCRLCRFITIMYYLNTVEEGAGGETAFLFADNSTLDLKGMEASFDGDFYNLRQSCYKSNLIIRPVKGTAIMWYNHFVDEKTGWLGSLDKYSFHGGCPVRSGEKWIANSWLTAPDAELSHLKGDFLWED